MRNPTKDEIRQAAVRITSGLLGNEKAESDIQFVEQEIERMIAAIFNEPVVAQKMPWHKAH